MFNLFHKIITLLRGQPKLNIKLESIKMIADHHRYSNPVLIPFERALTYVEEGRAVIINSSTIKFLMDIHEFKNFILQRDNHTCYYCGGYGDTIEHLKPHCHGGLMTPKNCVCACFECNQKYSLLSKTKKRKLASSRSNKKIFQTSIGDLINPEIFKKINQSQ